MKNEQLFPEQQKKLKKEAILRSIFSGLAVGFGVNFVAALVTWFLPINGLWISLALLLGVTAITAPIFYVKRFRPNNTTMARRIDRLGLEERLITMVELENNDSYLARVQRADAQAALAAMDKKLLKIRLTRAIVIAVIICAVLGCSMTTVNALGVLGVLPTGHDLLDSYVEEQTTVSVKVDYVAGTGGMIEGDDSQVIVQGTDTESVTAVAEDGYMFKCWSDGLKTPTRYDVGVMEDVTFTAEFVELDDDGKGDDDGLGDEPNDAVTDGDLKNGEENDSDQEDDNNDDENDSSGGGAWEPNNQIIDGKTYYRDILEEYQDMAEEVLKDPDNGLTDEEIELIKNYLGIV